MESLDSFSDDKASSDVDSLAINSTWVQHSPFEEDEFSPDSPAFQSALIKSDLRLPEAFTFQIFRWPVLLLIFLIIGIELILYILTRQLVALFERIFIWKGFNPDF
jgi:uncharacterized protein YfdQ (DUF2303 family)